MKKSVLGGVVLVICLAVGSCSGGGSRITHPAANQSTTTKPSASTSAPTFPPSNVVVSGPITGGSYGVLYNPTPTAILKAADYKESEYFIGGSADSFASAKPLTVDGKWTTAKGPKASYKTRIIVRRPKDPGRFNGKVLVEWLNVSAGRDSDPDWGFLNPYLTREGWAYVGVSVQQVGVQGGTSRLVVPGVPAIALAPLKQWDPVRYASLHQPGDAWSYGIYSDVARLLRSPGNVDPLGGLHPKTLVAIGESQSAFRMTTYVDAVQPIDKLYDGFLIHSRGGSAAALNDDTNGQTPPGLAIRTDLTQPVLQFETETDLIRLGFSKSRQPDSAAVRTWEVAGTAHADQSTLDYGSTSGKVWLKGDNSNAAATCGTINNGPQEQVLRAALDRLAVWIKDGTAPATSPRLKIVADSVVTGKGGNAVGGIRTPPEDAPISALSGKNNASSIFCSLFGQRRDYTSRELAALYPNHAAYVAAVTTASKAAEKAGFLLNPEGDAFIADAKSAAIP
jgi:hypothetical protein